MKKTFPLLFVTALVLILPRGAAARAQSAPAPTPSGAATATIPIGEYLDLKKQTERAKVTTIEDVRLRGTFGKSLSITFSGRCSGGLEPREVLDLNENYSLSNCKGEALLDAKEENIWLVPLAQSFSLTCELRAKNWNEFELGLHNAFAFTGDVAGAEIISDVVDSSHRKVALNPTRTSTARQNGQITGVAKYRITVETEEIRFRYTFRLNNPSRSVRPYEIRWVNGEIIQKARGLASYQEAEGGTRFSLNPGENDIEINGRFQGTKFKPLLASAQQYLMIESHPTLQLGIETKGRRISNNDPEMRPKFNNGRLYLFGKDTDFAWTTRKLEVLEAMGYSVSAAQYNYYVPEYGRPVVEARFSVNNQGTPEVNLEVPGVPTYLEVGGIPQVLYKGTEGSLLVQLPAGMSLIYLQYRPTDEKGGIVAGHRAELVKPNTVLSNVSVNLLTPPKWTVLAGASLVGAHSDFHARAFVFALALGLLFFAGAGFFKVGIRQQRALGALGLVLGFLSAKAFLFFVVASIVLVLVRYRKPIWAYFSLRPYRSALLGGILLVPLFLFLVSMLTSAEKSTSQMVARGFSNYQNMMPVPAAAPRAEPREADAEPSSESGEEVVGGTGGGSSRSAGVASPDDTQSYQGLPAKVEIPTDVRLTPFSQSMVDQRSKVVVRALLLSNSIVNGLAFMALVACLVLWFRNRRSLLHWAQLRA